MTTLLQDLRLGLRLFQRQPGFALVAVLVLGLGIAANTTIFSLVNALGLKPRLGAGDELVAVYSKNRTEPDGFRAFSYDNFSDLRSRKEIFASLTAHQPALVGIFSGGAWIAERLKELLGLPEEIGLIDVSFYRDDFAAKGLHPQVKPTVIPFAVEGRHLILVDAVLSVSYTTLTLPPSDLG